MIKKCLMYLRDKEISIQYMNRNINYLTETFDDDQLMHLLMTGVKIDNQHMMIQYIPGNGWKCFNEDYNYVGRKPVCNLIEKTLNESLMIEGGGTSSWYLPNLSNIVEIQQQANILNIDADVLLQAINDSIIEGKLVELSDEEWFKLENTDSVFKLNIDQIRQVGGKVDIIVESLRNGLAMEAPIVLYRENQPPYLVCGNTRLMVSKLLKHRPTILRITIY